MSENLEDRTVMKKLIVVDDESIVRSICSRIFSSSYHVIEAENGKIALDYFKDHSSEIAVVLMDVKMPVMNGPDAVRAIRRDYGNRIPIICISGSLYQDKERQDFLTVGYTDFLPKPFPVDILKDIVKKYAGN